MNTSTPSADCAWTTTDALYTAYHDEEWGRPVTDDDGVFERLALEAFQAGLSWLTVLRKRDAFRDAFSGFSIERVAAYTDRDVERLLANPGIIRNRQKIDAVIGNARAALALPRPLAQTVWAHQPNDHHRPGTRADLPSTSPEAVALATTLRSAGFRFIGPTTAYAAMQAIGLVNDHLVGCATGDAITAQPAFQIREAHPSPRPA